MPPAHTLHSTVSDRAIGVCVGSGSAEPLSPTAGPPLRGRDRRDDNVVFGLDHVLAVASSELIRTCNDLLDISRLEAGKMPLNLQLCNLTHVARSGIAAVKALASDRHVELQGPAELRALCDPDAMRRVVENLVSNALKFAPRDTEVKVELRRDLGSLQIRVSDEGPGIPIEYQEKIFDKFGQAQARREQQVHAAGLGLAYCKLAVQAHGGEITVRSKVGAGSIFIVTLPQSA